MRRQILFCAVLLTTALTTSAQNTLGTIVKSTKKPALKIDKSALVTIQTPNPKARILAPGSNASKVHSNITQVVPPQACISYSNGPDGQDYINGIDLNGLNTFGNGFVTGSFYVDNTSSATVLKVGQTYTLTVQGAGSNNETFGAWIDLDANGVYDSGELIAEAPSSGGKMSITFTVPLTNPLGPTTLRVIAQEDLTSGLDPCGVYTYGEAEDYSVDIVSAPPSCISYSSGPDSQDYINGIDLNGISTTNSFTSGVFYKDNTGITTALERGQSYALTIKGSGSNIETFGAWIDLDQDGLFDSSELIAEAMSLAGKMTISFSIPSTAILGSTVLRVIAQEDLTQNLDPCGTYTYGEAEDYGIDITAPTMPVAKFIANKYSGPAPLTVKFTDQSLNAPTNWSWNFGDGGMSIQQNPTYTFNTAGVYTVKLTATNGNGSSNTTKSITVTSVPSVTWINLSNQIFENKGGSINYGAPVVLLSNYSNSATHPDMNICADGSSASIIKYQNPNASLVAKLRFRIKSDPLGTNKDSKGIFKLADHSYNGDTVKVRFTHPEYINTNSLFIQDSIQIYNYQTSQVIYTYPVRFYRAPVVMSHGLWADRSSFEAMEKYLTYDVSSNSSGTHPYKLLYRVDYKPTHAAYFYQNSAVIPSAIYYLLNRARFYGFSAGKVDVVGHSMGGILTRLYLQSNYYTNDIHKLITLNTPHSGSQCGNLVSSSKWYGAVLRSGLAKIGNDPTKGAVADLSINSAAILSYLNGSGINNKKVPSHAITSTAPYLSFAPTQSVLGNFLSMFGGVAANLGYLGVTAPGQFHKDLFLGEASDLVVAYSSQRGGISVYTDFPSQQIHMGSPANPAIMNKVKSLLKANPNSGVDFSLNGFNPPALSSNFKMKNSLLDDEEEPFVNAGGGTVKINSPANGTIYNSGSQVTISISTTGNFKNILFAAGNNNIDMGYFRDTLATNVTLTYQIPNDYVGKINLSATGYDTTGLANDSIAIFVGTNSALDSISVYPERIYVAAGETAPLQVIGHYKDGVAREISFLPGVSYVSNNTVVASYMPANSIKGLKKSQTYFDISYAGKTKQVNVNVTDSLPAVITSAMNQLPYQAIAGKEQKPIDVINFPNPFNTSTTITYALNETAKISVDVFDVYGRFIKNIVNENQSKGKYNLQFDAGNLSSGIYYARLKAGNLYGRALMVVTK